MTTKIEPWMIDAVKSMHCAEYYTDAMAEHDARHIAAHAPKEKAAWEAKEKALEAENERLRKVTMEREEQLKSLLHATVKFVENYAPDHIKQELYNGLEKLNREQEKQS